MLCSLRTYLFNSISRSNFPFHYINLRKNHIVPQCPDFRNSHIHLRARDQILGRIQTGADSCAVEQEVSVEESSFQLFG